MSEFPTILKTEDKNNSISISPHKNITKYIDFTEDFKKELKNFKIKAQKHINYLKVLMFIIVVFLNEINKFTNQQLFYISFIIIFNIAFSQNLLNNVPKIKK